MGDKREIKGSGGSWRKKKKRGGEDERAGAADTSVAPPGGSAAKKPVKSTRFKSDRSLKGRRPRCTLANPESVGAIAAASFCRRG